MFSSKKTTLFDKEPKQTSATGNPFTNAVLKTSAVTKSGNGAKKFSKTNDELLNQFNQLGSYRYPRSYENISEDMDLMWAVSPQDTLRLVIYLRAITRNVMLPDGSVMETATRGGELKHESIMRMMWISNKNKKMFFDNLLIFVSVGSWRDVFDMLRYDLVYHGWEGRVLDWNKMFDIIAFGLMSEHHSELIKKYLPQISAKSDCHTARKQANTIIGKWLASQFGLNYEQYRKMKSSGTAHTWQQHISKRDFGKIDFNKIHGRALAKLVGGKFLENQNLVGAYTKWIETQPVAKYTGYPYELLSGGVPNDLHKQITINKQFMGLVEKGKSSGKALRLLTVVDTSGSMSAPCMGTDVSSITVAKSMAIYFSYFLNSRFSNIWLEFNSKVIAYQFNMGNEPLDKLKSMKSSTIGNTNFLGVANYLVETRKSGVPESEFPDGILAISDGEFDSAGSVTKTNFQAFKEIMLTGGFSPAFVENFKIILWDTRNSYYGRRKANFETYENDVPNVFYFSGLNPSIIAFLTGGEEMSKDTPEPKNAEDVVKVAMSQAIMDYLVF